MKSIGQNTKTLYSSVQASMIDEVVEFHNKANMLVDSHFRMRMIPYTVTREQLQALEKSDSELVPFHDKDIVCDSYARLPVRRQQSATQFSNAKIAFSKIKSLLRHAFYHNEEGKRPYPSGGALYPMEVICVIYQERLLSQELESGVYHYRATQNVLQPLKKIPSETLRHVLYQMELVETANPAFSLIYVGNLARMLVKYRYRGYRYALMETGAMFHQADLIAKELGLVNKLYSGFNDHELVHLLGLDKLNYLPFIVQSFGGGV